MLAAFAREATAPGAGMGYGRYNQATLGWRAMRNYVLPLIDPIEVPTLLFHGALDRLGPCHGPLPARSRA